MRGFGLLNLLQDWTLSAFSCHYCLENPLYWGILKFKDNPKLNKEVYSEYSNDIGQFDRRLYLHGVSSLHYPASHWLEAGGKNCHLSAQKHVVPGLIGDVMEWTCEIVHTVDSVLRDGVDRRGAQVRRSQ